MAALQVIGVVAIHLVFLASVFDIYFQSPVVDVLESHRPKYTAPARRLVLFIADGLRASSFFSNDMEDAPFLRDVIMKHGTWGTSHTRVPTESRPGHVAIIAGMYEDPSAITRGWKENPVDFDTVFNQSTWTWSWGSPDILPMFSKGVHGDQMTTEMYSAEQEDFFGKEALEKLDSWVFQHVQTFFSHAMKSPDLQVKLRDDKIVLFLHLLGCDSNGHAKGPNSVEYRNNIRLVDEGIKNTVELIEGFWRHDDRTAFIFTSDHGMTNWGSHGTGMDDETQVPIVAWGAGINHPVIKQAEKSNSSEGLSRLKHFDVEQADIAPLMSSLIGAGIPKHSVGKLPLDYLKLRPQDQIDAQLAVAKQAFSMFQSQARRFVSYWHTPFSKMNGKIFKESVQKIHNHERVGKFESALQIAKDLAATSLEGFDYFRVYYKWHLYFAITVSYLGLMFLVTLHVIQTFLPIIEKRTKAVNQLMTMITSLSLMLTAVVAFFCQNVPKHYLVYYLTPGLVWHFIIKSGFFLKLWSTVMNNKISILARSLPILVILESCIASFFNRVFLIPCILGTTVIQLYYSKKKSFQQRALFAVLNTILCAFALQPTVGKSGNVLAVIAAAGFSVAAMVYIQTRTHLLNVSSIQTKILTCCLLLSGLLVGAFSTDILVHGLAFLKPFMHMLTWAVFLLSVPLSLLASSRQDIRGRLICISVGLQTAYIILSLSYEGLFLLTLIATLYVWYVLEDKHTTDRDQDLVNYRERNILTEQDFFRALLFLSYSIVSFFGTGNIASLNSFDPKSIRCLVSVFSPFLMGSVLLLKVLIPFLVVSCYVFSVVRVSRMPSQGLFLLVLLFSDVMGLHFFFLVTDQGSWLEIGTSLSHFIIAQATVIFLQVFYLLAGWMMIGVRKSKDQTTKVIDVAFNSSSKTMKELC